MHGYVQCRLSVELGRLLVKDGLVLVVLEVCARRVLANLDRLLFDRGFKSTTAFHLGLSPEFPPH